MNFIVVFGNNLSYCRKHCFVPNKKIGQNIATAKPADTRTYKKNMYTVKKRSRRVQGTKVGAHFMVRVLNLSSSTFLRIKIHQKYYPTAAMLSYHKASCE